MATGGPPPRVRAWQRARGPGHGLFRHRPLRSPSLARTCRLPGSGVHDPAGRIHRQRGTPVDQGRAADPESDLQWVLSGYALAFGLVLIPGGRLGDARGRRAVFMVGLSLFTLSSAACGPPSPAPGW
ncbi:MFS transporter [Streptomyces sp. M10(2022)]